MGIGDAEALEAELEKSLGKERLENLISEKSAQFHGLLTRDAAVFAISKEMKVQVPQKPITLSELTIATKRATVLARVGRAFEPRSFQKNGKEGKVCRVLLSDEKAKVPLVLWNEDVGQVERGELLQGDLIELSGVYLKEGELRLGYGGHIKVLERVRVKSLSELSEGEAVNLSVEIVETYGVRRYERDGATKEMSSCLVRDASGKARLVLWEPNAHALDGARGGDTARVEGGRMKNGEMHAGNFAKIILIQKPISPSQLTADFEGELEGKVESVDVFEEGLLAKMEGDGETGLFFSKAASLKLLGLKSLPDDVNLKTVLSLKGAKLAGSVLRVRGKAKPGDGRLSFFVEKIIS